MTDKKTCFCGTEGLTMDQFGACEHCDEILCPNCTNEHYNSNHIDPRSITKEEWEEIDA